MSAPEQLKIEELQFVEAGRVAALALEPGDVVVLQCERLLTRDQHERLGAVIQKRFPGHEVVVLDAGLKLGVVRGGDRGGIR